MAIVLRTLVVQLRWGDNLSSPNDSSNRDPRKHEDSHEDQPKLVLGNCLRGMEIERTAAPAYYCCRPTAGM